jgi:hypothetical protein
VLLGAHFEGADLTEANLRNAVLRHASFDAATLKGANLSNCNLYHVSFIGGDLHQIDLWGASITESDFTDACMTEARLRGTNLIRCNFTGCDVSRSLVYGCAVWDVDLSNCVQQELVVTPDSEKQRWRGTGQAGALCLPTITVDNVELAQFVYLITHNAAIRRVLDTLTSKVVLILGRFSNPRKKTLDCIRDTLRTTGYVPVLFDFAASPSLDLTETVRLLAHMSRFVIADLSDPRSIPHELMSIVPDLPSVAVQMLILRGQSPYATVEHLTRYPWVRPLLEYSDDHDLLARFDKDVVMPAEALVAKLRGPRTS